MRFPIVYKFVLGFIIVIAAVVFSPKFVGALGYSAEMSGALAYVVDRDDMGVRQAGCRLCLASEALSDFLLESQLGWQHLDGHTPMQALIARAIDHAHSTAADFALDGILITQRLLQALREGTLI